MEIGFTVIGESTGDALIKKGNLKVGDGLYLTKPIGIGVLLAAQMRSLCAAHDFVALVDAMLQPQDGYSRIAVESKITAGTDVTGFGLAGHLLEMLDASNVGATLELGQIPTLSGAVSAVESGITSSLAPDNRVAAAKVETDMATRKTAAFDLLFDPQTCGGLLFGVAESQGSRFVEACRDQGLLPPVRIGTIDPCGEGKRPLRVVDSSNRAATH